MQPVKVKKLRENANITKSVIILGVDNHAEIWAEEEYNKYLCALGTVVKVTYENGASFILNYNSFQITANGKTIEPLSYLRIK